MKHFRKVWTDELNGWLVSTKGMKTRDAFEVFREKYPDVDVTYIAFANQRSRMGASPPSVYKGGRGSRPLYSEQTKKDYVRIKVAMPNVWMQKSEWVYKETHPWEDFSEKSHYIFLDGDNRNFDPENIMRVPLSVMGIFASLGGNERGRPDVTRLRVAQALLKKKVLDIGEKAGDVVNYHNSRKFRSDLNEYARKLRKRPEVKERMRARKKEYMERLKADPVKYAEYKAKQKAYQHEWYLRQKKEGKR